MDIFMKPVGSHAVICASLWVHMKNWESWGQKWQMCHQISS